jgi:hypothetical protein
VPYEWIRFQIHRFKSMNLLIEAFAASHTVKKSDGDCVRASCIQEPPATAGEHHAMCDRRLVGANGFIVRRSPLNNRALVAAGTSPILSRSKVSGQRSRREQDSATDRRNEKRPRRGAVSPALPITLAAKSGSRGSRRDRIRQRQAP